MKRSLRGPARSLAWGLVLSLCLGWGSEGWAEESSPRIVAVGDVHGSPDALSSLLQAAELMDETGNWIGGDAILVQTGDLTDRGAGVREVLDMMRNLERSAAENGGRVEGLLGNHEVFNLLGYYDYQSTPIPVFAEISKAFSSRDSEKTRRKAYKEWSTWARKYPACAVPDRDAWMARNPLGFVEYQEAMSQRGEYGRWLRGKKVVVQIRETLFLHGGLSPELVDMGMRSLDSINTTAAGQLEQFDRDREFLERQGLITRTATLSEIHCAVAYELQALTAAELDAVATLRFDKLEELRARLPSGENWLLLDPRGPVWFRGYARWTKEEGEVGLAAVFELFGGARVVVGHTPQPGAIVARFDDRVFLIDTAMAYPELKGGAVALEIRGDVISAINVNGRTHLAGPEPAVVEREQVEVETPATNSAHQTVAAAETSRSAGPWLAEDGSPLPFADEDAVIEFLQTASVVEKEKIGKGITEAERLVLEKKGIRARAAFHDVNVMEPRHNSKGGGLIMNFRDSYLNNVAAYELGHLLGLTNIAPATIRKVGRTTGSVQLWIEEAIDESQRRARGGREAMTIRLRSRIDDMWVFDNLIYNIDRNQGNMLHDSRGELWMIDHTRSFNGSKRLPNPARVKRCSRELLAAIRDLDEARVRDRLDPYLTKIEMNGLLVRRLKLLEYLEERIATLGEETFLFSHEGLEEGVTVYYEPEEIPESSESSSEQLEPKQEN